jgi:4-amino-4-deoxy-L-arabinose transferase-like glycosyltransferase
MAEAALSPRWAPIERAIARWFDRADQTSVAVLLVVFVAAWTLFHTIAYAAIGLHPDVTEMYGWSRHLMPSYDKHPPLGAVICAAWFAIFPATDWSFHLMAMVNAAVALYFVDLIARRYVAGDKRLMVLLLLLATPFYQFHARRFGANQALLATWPLATYCFLCAFETRALTWSIAAGAAAALAMLGKYFSIYLIGAFVVAALTHPARMAYLKSLSPWASVCAGIVVLSPHLYWLTTTGFQTLDYAAPAEVPASLGLLFAAATYLAGALGYVALPIAIYLFVARPDRRALADALWPSDPNLRMLVVLLAAIIFLPALSAPVVGPWVTVLGRLTPLWTMQSWFLLPIVLLAPPSVVVARRAGVQVACGLLAIAIAAVIAVAPALAWTNFRDGEKDNRGYYRQMSEDVTRTWRARVGRPLAVVLGDHNLTMAVQFYSPDHPDAVPDFVTRGAAPSRAAPWVTPERIAREGWAAVCRSDDASCIGEAAAASAQEPRSMRHTIEIAPRFLGFTGTPVRFVIFIVPPRAFAFRGRSAQGTPA